MCIFFGRKLKKNAFIGAENEKENEIPSASTRSLSQAVAWIADRTAS